MPFNSINKLKSIFTLSRPKIEQISHRPFWKAWLPILALTVKNGFACLRKGNRRRYQYHVASISHQFRRPIYLNAHASSSFDHAHLGSNSVFKQIRRCSVDGRKRYENDKCGRSIFVWKRISVDRALVFTKITLLLPLIAKNIFYEIKIKEK